MHEGLDPVKDELRQDAQQQAKAIAEQAEEEGERIVNVARQQAKEIVFKAKQEAEMLATDEATKVSSSRLRASKITAEAREQAISAALVELLEVLSSQASAKGDSRKQYEKLFAKLAKTALSQVEGGVIRCRQQDAALAKQFGALGKPLDCSGGLAVESPDGRIKLDATFEGLIEELKDELKKKAFALLYGK